MSNNSFKKIQQLYEKTHNTVYFLIQLLELFCILDKKEITCGKFVDQNVFYATRGR